MKKHGKEVARVVYSPHKPLSCGARVWVETQTDDVDVELIVRESASKTLDNESDKCYNKETGS